MDSIKEEEFYDPEQDYQEEEEGEEKKEKQKGPIPKQGKSASEIGKLITLARNKKKMTRAALAKVMNLKLQDLTDYETGRTKPSKNILYQFEQYLKIKLS